MVETPSLFPKEEKTSAQINNEDEIEKLVRIFSKFYNEEKIKGANSQKRSIERVSMLPMQSTINLNAQGPYEPAKEEY